MTKLNAALYLVTSAREWKILNISFLWVGIKPTISRVDNRTFVPLRHDWPVWPRTNSSLLDYVKKKLRVFPLNIVFLYSLMYAPFNYVTWTRQNVVCRLLFIRWLFPQAVIFNWIFLKISYKNKFNLIMLITFSLCPLLMNNKLVVLQL